MTHAQANDMTPSQAKQAIADGLETERAIEYFANTQEQNDYIVIAQRKGVEAAIEAVEDYAKDED